MASLKLSKTITVVLIVALLGAAGYYFYSTSSSGSSFELLLPQESEPVGQDILVLAERLNSISFDTDIFVSPLFTNLKDFEPTVISEPKGRANPFANIGVENSGAAIEFLIREPSDSAPRVVPTGE